MDYNRAQTNQTVQPHAAAGPRSTASNVGGNSQNNKSKKSRVVLFAGLLLATVAIVVGALFFVLQNKNSETSPTGIDEDGYQAVFMTNGQVYFGRLEKLEADYNELTDVYYLQVQQDVQPAEEKTTNDQSQVSLTKLGNELHGPKDRMFIAKDQILFWENLKQDSTVVKAIAEYKSKRQ